LIKHNVIAVSCEIVVILLLIKNLIRLAIGQQQIYCMNLVLRQLTLGWLWYFVEAYGNLEMIVVSSLVLTIEDTCNKKNCWRQPINWDACTTSSRIEELTGKHSSGHMSRFLLRSMMSISINLFIGQSSISRQRSTKRMILLLMNKINEAATTHTHTQKN